MNRSHYFKIPLLVLTFVAIQRSQLGTLTISGVHPDFLLAVSIFFGVVEGREVGALMGFVFGLFGDSFALIPFGVSSLVYAIAGYVAGMIEVTTLPESRILETLIVGVVSAGGEAMLAGVLNILAINTLLNGQILDVVTVVALTSAVFSVPLIPLLKWVLRVGLEDRPPSRRGIRD